MRLAALAMLAPLGALMSMLTSLPDSVSPAPFATSPDEMTPQGRVAVRRLEAADLAVVINTADPLSVAVGNYYIRARRIARRNVAHVSFDYQRDDLPENEFIPLKAAVERQVGLRIQAYALTWARPYRVGCVSITYAFAIGPDNEICSGGCRKTPLNPYFDASTTVRPEATGR
jgi:hypothetical protein